MPVPRREVGFVRASARRRASTTASGAAPGATSSPSCARSSTSTSPARSSTWRPRRASPCATPTSGEGEGRKQRQQLLDAVARAADWYHERLLSAPDAGPGPRLPAQRAASAATRCATTAWAGRPRGGTSWPRSLKLPDQVAQGLRARLHQLAGPPDRRLPGPGAVPDLRRQGRPGGVRRAHPARADRPGQVQELDREPDLRQEQGPLRAQLGQGGHRGGRRGHRVRGLHRRHRVRRGRPAPGGGHLRHRAHRGALQDPQELRPPGGAGLRRRRRGPERGRPRSTSGSGPTTSTWRWPRCPPASTRPTWPGPTPRRCAAAVDQATPFLGFRVGAGARLGVAGVARGPGPGRGAGHGGHRRAPQRAGA